MIGVFRGIINTNGNGRRLSFPLISSSSVDQSCMGWFKIGIFQWSILSVRLIIYYFISVKMKSEAGSTPWPPLERRYYGRFVEEDSRGPALSIVDEGGPLFGGILWRGIDGESDA